MVCLNEAIPSVGEGQAVMDHGQGCVGRPTLLTVRDVAAMLSCSPRTVYRLNDSGRMPRAVKLGALVRWPKATVQRWIDEGCPRAENTEVTR